MEKTQTDIWNWFKNRYFSGDKGYFPIRLVNKAMCEDIGSTDRKVRKLYQYGFLERRKFDNVIRYRFKNNSFNDSLI